MSDEKSFKTILKEKLYDEYHIIQKHGACRKSMDPRFHSNDLVDINRVINIYCRNCSVTEECLNFALANREYGVWGGTTEDDRLTMIERSKKIVGSSPKHPFQFPSAKTLPVVLEVAKEMVSQPVIPLRTVGRPGKEKKTRPNPLVKVENQST